MGGGGRWGGGGHNYTHRMFSTMLESCVRCFIPEVYQIPLDQRTKHVESYSQSSL